MLEDDYHEWTLNTIVVQCDVIVLTKECSIKLTNQIYSAGSSCMNEDEKYHWNDLLNSSIVLLQGSLKNTHEFFHKSLSTS